MRGWTGSATLGSMFRAQFLVFFAVFAVGCAGCSGRRGNGGKAVGEPCGSNDECSARQCVAGVAGEAPVCTRSCGHASDCPEGWYCSGVTGSNVVVCSKAAPTPFGGGGGR